MNLLVSTVVNDLAAHFAGDQSMSPTEKWIELQIYQLLQQYPSGISRAVMLTELEYKWFLFCLDRHMFGFITI